MTKLVRAMVRAAALAFLLTSVVVPSARAQEAPLDRAELTRYARAHIAMDAARDAFHATIARTHDDVGLAKAREEMDARVARILIENQLTTERYGVIRLSISQNESLRMVFDEISTQLRAAAAPAAPR